MINQIYFYFSYGKKERYQIKEIKLQSIAVLMKNNIWCFWLSKVKNATRLNLFF